MILEGARNTDLSPEATDRFIVDNCKNIYLAGYETTAKNEKGLTMVIHETLRLYPPVTVVSREAFKDMKFGDINVPKGVNVWTTVVTLHTGCQCSKGLQMGSQELASFPTCTCHLGLDQECVLGRT
ncbi:unnamed protein product [Prunus brigantina]